MFLGRRNDEFLEFILDLLDLLLEDDIDSLSEDNSSLKLYSLRLRGIVFEGDDSGELCSHPNPDDSDRTSGIDDDDDEDDEDHDDDDDCSDDMGGADGVNVDLTLAS